MINAPRHQLFRRCVYVSGCRTEHPATDAPLEQMCNAARCARRDEPGMSALQPAAVRMCSVPTHSRSWTVSKKVLSLFFGGRKNHIAPKVFSLPPNPLPFSFSPTTSPISLTAWHKATPTPLAAASHAMIDNPPSVGAAWVVATWAAAARRGHRRRRRGARRRRRSSTVVFDVNV